MTRRPSRRAGADGLHLSLITGDVLKLRRLEIAQVLLHPHLFAVYLAVWVALILADPSGQPYAASLSQRAVQYGLGTLAVVLSLGMICLAAEGLRGGRGRPVVLLGAPAIYAAALLGLTASEIVAHRLVEGHVWSVKLVLILSVFYYTFAEATVQLCAWLLVPRILAQLRAPHADLADPGAVPTRSLVAGGRLLDVTRLLHLEARGNYVAITWQGTARPETIEVPGPFSALLDQLPPDLGFRIHRSHWVARRAVAGHRRKGREMVLALTHGVEAPVALPRHAEVLAWLQSQVQIDP